MITASVTSEDLADLAVAIKYEDDGKAMRRELLQNLRKATRPALVGAKASIMSMPSSGLLNPGGSLRRAIAKEIKQETKLSGRSAKVKIKVKKQQIRGFNNPAKRTNMTDGWRHPIFPKKGRKNDAAWVRQIGKPNWFDGEMKKRHAEYRAAVKAAMDHTAERIARNT